MSIEKNLNYLQFELMLLDSYMNKATAAEEKKVAETQIFQNVFNKSYF